MIQDEINKVIMEISKTKEEVYKKALNHFRIEIEQIPDRVKVYYAENSIEQVFIDDKMVLTFSPLEVGLGGKISMNYKEHYLTI